MKKAYAFWIALALLVVVSPLLQERPAVAGSAQSVFQNIPYDISSQLKNRAAPRQSSTTATTQATATHDGRAPDLVLTLEDWSAGHAGNHDVAFWLERTGTKSYVYVAWNDLAAPAASAQQYQQITRDDIEYIGQQFDNNIWASDVDHFGKYVNRPAKDPKISLMIYNIRDDAYWSNSNYYTAGYFWASLDQSLNRNIVFLDSFDWPNRTRATASQPFLYEGTLAHEFEHLIHNDIDPDEVAFIDEGLADLAQFFAGYGHPAAHIAYYMVYHRDSLTNWDGELYDYGSAYLWQLYLEEHFGGPKFTKNLVAEQENGLAGVQKVLQEMAPGADLATVFRDWTLANLLDGQTDNPAWNYQSLTIPSDDTWGYSIPWSIVNYYNSTVPGNVPPTRKTVRNQGGVEPWGAYYLTFKGTQPAMLFTFKGDPQEGVVPITGSLEWYGGMGNLLNNTLSRSLTLGTNATLSFRTWYDIEANWDFGYVEVSQDGSHWTVLRPTSAVPYNTSNINNSSAWSGSGGLTGNSGGWVTASFDLSAFTGPVTVRLRYATDEAVNGLGWYADEFLVKDNTGTVFADSVSGQNGWQAAGWSLTNGLMPNRFSASLIVPHQKASKTWTEITHLNIDPNTGGATRLLDTTYLKDNVVTAVINNHPDGLFDANFQLTGLKAP